MAIWYVSSVAGSGGTNAGTSWANAFLKEESAYAASASGDFVAVDSAHSYTSSGVNISYAVPSAGNRISVVSVNRNGSTTTGWSAWLAGATETNGLNVSALNWMNQAGDYYHYGLTGIGNNGNNGNNRVNMCGLVSAAKASGIFDTCVFDAPDTRTNILSIGSGANAGMIQHIIKWYNCTLRPPNITTGDGILVGSVDLFVSNLTINPHASQPAALFGLVTTGSTPNLQVVDSDLTGYTNASGALFDTTGHRGSALLRNCKISASPAVTNSGVFGNDQSSITMVNTDSGNTSTQYYYQTSLGVLTGNTTTYDNSGFKVNGTNMSCKIVTTSNCNEWRPFVTPYFIRDSTSTSSTVAGVHFVHDSVTNLTNRDIWADFEYISSASFPLGTLVSKRSATPYDLTGTDWASDSDTWTGTGGFSNPNKQKIETTYTPAQYSVHRARVFVTATSKTLYVDPLLRLV